MALMTLLSRAGKPAERGFWIKRVDYWVSEGGMNSGDCGRGGHCNCSGLVWRLVLR